MDARVAAVRIARRCGRGQAPAGLRRRKSIADAARFV